MKRFQSQRKREGLEHAAQVRGGVSRIRSVEVQPRAKRDVYFWLGGLHRRGERKKGICIWSASSSNAINLSGETGSRRKG